MDIRFATRKIAKLCNDGKVATQKLGPNGAKKLRNRLDDLADLPSMHGIRGIAGRPHPMKGDRAGQWSLDLDGAWRLIFRPVDEEGNTVFDPRVFVDVEIVTIDEVTDPH